MKTIKFLFLLLFVLNLQMVFGQTTTIDQVVYDMAGPVYRTTNQGYPWGKHEGVLENGNTSFAGFDWYEGSKPGTWMQGVTGGYYKAINTWGQAYPEEGYIASGGTLNLHFRVQIRNLKVFAYRNGAWDQIINTPSPNVSTGWSNYTYAFAGTGTTSNARSEANNGGGISITMPNDRMVHWWDDTWPRAAMPSNAQAVVSYAEIRLIPNTDPNVNLNNVKVLAAEGMDTYVSNTTVSDGTPVSSAGIPRHKYVTSQWKSFTMYVVGNPAPTTNDAYRNLILSKPYPPFVSAGTTISVTGISVSPTSTSIAVGATQTLTATIAPSNATNQGVTYTSSNNSIVTVNASGLITAVAAGSATITATANDQTNGVKTASCSVTVTAAQVNIALNKTSVASSIEGSGLEASKAFDGNTGTRWASGTTATASIYVDLGATYNITRVNLNWEYAYATAYQIQVSNDATNWTSIYSTTTGNGATDDLTGLTGTGRYVRMNGTTRATTWGYSLWEFAVYGTPGSSVAVTGVSVSPTSASLNLGSTQQLTKTIAPANATNQNVSWSSSNTAIATVNASGLVTGVAAGTATITVTAADQINGVKTATCTVTVASTPPAGNLLLNPGFEGASNWSINNTTVFSISTADKRSGASSLRMVGTTSWGTTHQVVTVTSNTDYSLKAWLKGTAKTQFRVGVNPSWALIKEQQFTPTSGSWTEFTMTFNSGNNTQLVIAWQDAGYGTTYIDDATLSGGTTIAVTGVTVSPTSASLAVGTTTSLTATVAPSNATNKTVSWTSNNTSVATVNSSGVVTGVAAGSATITVTTQDGNKTATCAVTVTTVNVPVTGVSVSPTSASIAIGATQQLTKTTAPTNATNQIVSWSSSNTAVATVNASGLVTGVAAGTATITVTAVDQTNGIKTATCAVTVTGGSTLANLILNPEFDNGTTSWGLWNASGNTSTMSVVTNASLSGTNALLVDITTATGTSNVILYQGMNFVSGKTYKISFTAKAAASKVVKVALQQNGGSWTEYYTTNVTVGTTAQTFGPFSYTATVSTVGDIKFHLGANNSDIWIDNVVVTDGSLKSAFIATGVADVKTSNVRMFPNPVTGNELSIQTSNVEESIQICIFDYSGKKVFSHVSRNTDKIIVNTNDFSSKGLHFVNVITGSNSYTGKVVIK